MDIVGGIGAATANAQMTSRHCTQPGILEKCQPPPAPRRGLLLGFKLLKPLEYLLGHSQSYLDHFAPTRAGADIFSNPLLTQRPRYV